MARVRAESECENSRMANFRSDVIHPTQERSLKGLSGFISAHVGLFLYALSDSRLMHFISSVVVLDGILLLITQLIAKPAESSADQ